MDSIVLSAVVALALIALLILAGRTSRARAEQMRMVDTPTLVPPPEKHPRNYTEEVGVLDVDLADLVVDAMNRFVEAAQAKRLELVVSVDESVPERLWGETAPVHQVLTDFIDNAVKFTSSGHVTVTATVVEEREAVMLVRFTVTDSGPGISPNRQATLFERGDGPGFGLSASHAVIERLGGTCGLFTTLGRGSTFWFCAPFGVDATAATRMPEPVPVPMAVQPEPEPAPVAVEPEPEPEPELTRHGNLLLAEDDPVNRRMTLAMLQRTGYRVEVVTDGLEAVRAVAARRFDAVIMDCRMPRMDGLQATSQIRAAEGKRRHTPIIALSAGTTVDERTAALSAGMDEYLAKPVQTTELLDVLGRFLPESAAVS